MTAVFYPDQRAASPDGRFLLEALSPHNGAIQFGNGRWATDDDFAFAYRQHQSSFRYRLVDRRNDARTIWERWQHAGENSPHELIVSDNGWSILRLHGTKPKVVAVSPTGEDAVRVRIESPGGASADERQAREFDPEALSWIAERCEFTTAGNFWTSHSWPYFLRQGERDYFVWRTYWGARLILDLKARTILDSVDPSSPLACAMDDSERRGAHDLLASLSARMPEIREILGNHRAHGEEEVEADDELLTRLHSAKAAIHLAGVHGDVDALPFLREWEAIDREGYSTGSRALPETWLQVQSVRPIVCHSIKKLGEEPVGYANYQFTYGIRTWDSPEQPARFPLPEKIADRNERLRRFKKRMSVEEALTQFGSPDHIRNLAPSQTRSGRWREAWEYDVRENGVWSTVRLTWEVELSPVRLVRIEREPSPWLSSDERPNELLGHF